MLFIICRLIFYTSTLGVRRRTDESDFINKIMGLKGGEAPDIFRLRQGSKKIIFCIDAQLGMFVCHLINRRRRRLIK
jgi:hypothetical protein